MAVLAVGSDLRADDAAGLLAAEQLVAMRRTGRQRMKVFFGQTAPENFTGEIRKYQPSHLVVLDAADSGRPGGTVTIADASAAGVAYIYCTHNLPLTVMLNYLAKSLDCQAFIIGIQPHIIEFGQPSTPAIQRAAKRVAKALHEAMS